MLLSLQPVLIGALLLVSSLIFSWKALRVTYLQTATPAYISENRMGSLGHLILNEIFNILRYPNSTSEHGREMLRKFSNMGPMGNETQNCSTSIVVDMRTSKFKVESLLDRIRGTGHKIRYLLKTSRPFPALSGLCSKFSKHNYKDGEEWRMFRELDEQLRNIMEVFETFSGDATRENWHTFLGNVKHLNSKSKLLPSWLKEGSLGLRMENSIRDGEISLMEYRKLQEGICIMQSCLLFCVVLSECDMPLTRGTISNTKFPKEIIGILKSLEKEASDFLFVVDERYSLLNNTAFLRNMEHQQEGTAPVQRLCELDSLVRSKINKISDNHKQYELAEHIGNWLDLIYGHFSWTVLVTKDGEKLRKFMETKFDVDPGYNAEIYIPRYAADSNSKFIASLGRGLKYGYHLCNVTEPNLGIALIWATRQPDSDYGESTKVEKFKEKINAGMDLIQLQEKLQDEPWGASMIMGIVTHPGVLETEDRASLLETEDHIEDNIEIFQTTKDGVLPLRWQTESGKRNVLAWLKLPDPVADSTVGSSVKCSLEACLESLGEGYVKTMKQPSTMVITMFSASAKCHGLYVKVTRSDSLVDVIATIAFNVIGAILLCVSLWLAYGRLCKPQKIIIAIIATLGMLFVNMSLEHPISIPCSYEPAPPSNSPTP